MESIRELYRIGTGPSSSHAMGPRRGAQTFRQRQGDAARYRVTLYGSLAATGTGHLTDAAVRKPPSDGTHRIPFDDAVAVMGQTGRDLPASYRETAAGWLAAAYQLRR